MPDKTKILSVHKLRRKAREEEDRIQTTLDHAWDIVAKNPEIGVQDGIQRLLEANGIPKWAHGVRVDKAGMFQHAVVATEHKGH